VQLTGGLAFLIFCLRRHISWPARSALLLLAAGAFGNGLDRLFRGHVVDFIHLTHWPVFNVADVYITVGGILLLLKLRPVRNWH
jgi:signal peptidase II